MNLASENFPYCCSYCHHSAVGQIFNDVRAGDARTDCRYMCGIYATYVICNKLPKYIIFGASLCFAFGTHIWSYRVAYVYGCSGQCYRLCWYNNFFCFGYISLCVSFFALSLSLFPSFSIFLLLFWVFGANDFFLKHFLRCCCCCLDENDAEIHRFVIWYSVQK